MCFGFLDELMKTVKLQAEQESFFFYPVRNAIECRRYFNI